MIPDNYNAWYDCITKNCNIDLTSSYIKNRIKCLSDPANKHTVQFISLYGNAYHQQVLHWFETALKEV